MEDHTDCEDIDSAGEDDDDGEQETYNIAGEWMDAPQKRSCSFFNTVQKGVKPGFVQAIGVKLTDDIYIMMQCVSVCL